MIPPDTHTQSYKLTNTAIRRVVDLIDIQAAVNPFGGSRLFAFVRLVMMEDNTGKITALEVQKRNKERVNVYIDGEFAFGLNLMDATTLRRGQVLSAEEITTLQNHDAVVRAVDSAVHFLQYRPRSSTEVRRNLIKKKINPNVIDAAMSRLEALGYLDDEQFAKFWVENRNTFKPRSPLALRTELRQKGVSDTIINRVVESIDAYDAAYRAAQGKLSRYRGGTVLDFKRKLGGFLGRRGFSFEVINEVLSDLIQEMQDTDYFQQDDEPPITY